MFYSAKSQIAVDCTIVPFHINADAEDVCSRILNLSIEDRTGCIDFASANGLLRLLGARLEELGCLHELPPDFAEPLAAALEEGERIGQQRRAEVLEVISALQEARLAALVLKGAALEYLLYPRVGVRPMRDLDLLFEPGCGRQASSVLEQLGFSALPGEHEPDHHLPRLIRQRADGTQFAIDVHHRLVPPKVYGIRVGEIEGLWDRSMSIDAGQGIKLRTLSLEDHILHLHIHLFHHLFYNFRLVHLVDIVLAARTWQGSLDWKGVLDRLERIGLSQFRCDLWTWIRQNFGDVLLTEAEVTDAKTAKLGRWLFRHGSLPTFSGLRYSKNFREWGATLTSECRRCAYRSLWAPGWGILGSRSA